MYSGEALALFICYYNFFLCLKTAVKKKLRFPGGIAQFFFFSADSARAIRRQQSNKEKKINFIFFCFLPSDR